MSENSNQNQQPAYYAIIPSEVRYCKDLEPSAKLLYGEITALCQKEGYCWANNRFFAELYEVDSRTIRRWLESLRRNNFIICEMEEDSFNPQRIIYLAHNFQKMFTVRQKCHGGGKETSGGPDKNSLHSITSNTTSNNPPPSPPPKPKPIEDKQSLRSDLSLRSEEEDFFINDLLNSTTLSPSDKSRLKKDYSNDQLVNALKIAKTLPIKKSFMGLLLDILNNPERYRSSEIKTLTPAQQIALQYNQKLLKVAPKLAKANEKSIEEDAVTILIEGYVQKLSLKAFDFMQDIKRAMECDNMLGIKT